MGKLIILIVAVLVIAAGSSIYFFTFQKPVLTERDLPWLHTEENKLVDENGKAIILRGVAIEDPGYGLGRGLNERDFVELTQNWKVNVIRIPVHPDLWEQNPSYTTDYLDKIILFGKKYGMYILLGWHAHGNPITGEVEHVEYQYPYKGNPYNPDFDLAVQFWEKISERYKNNPGVMYSIFNEPAYMSWDEWGPVAEQLIDIIRARNPNSLILVSGVEWGYDLREVGKNPIGRNNILYEVHPYPGQANQHGPWDEYFGYLAEKYPVFVGEWGFDPNSLNENLKAGSENYGEILLDYMRERRMSWTAWVWSPEWEPSMLKNWDYDTTEFGNFIKNALDRSGQY